MQSIFSRFKQWLIVGQRMRKAKATGKLVLSNLELEALPDSISQLIQLQELDLSNNKLTSLPEFICQLTQLQRLIVDKNQLTSLPDSIGQLTQLKQLNVSDNQLTALPAGLRSLQSLEELYLHGNRELGLPAEIQSTKPSDILDSYFSAPFNEAKLIVIGFKGVGKTSLVNRLLHDDFSINRNEPKTAGIQIEPWTISLAGKEIHLNVWELGGDDFLHATHQFFFTRRSLYLLVLSSRHDQEGTDAEYWLDMVHSFGADSPVIIVLNKLHERPFTINRNGLLQKYPNIRAYVDTDCVDATGIEELRQAITCEIDGLPQQHASFLASWVDVKERMASMEDNYISFATYRQICTENRVTDSEAQESLATWLHDLGTILSYHNHPWLPSTHVLNPRWFTRCLYAILTAKQLIDQHGELDKADLRNILKPDDYSTEHYDFLLDTMCQFELCFRLDENGERYLIPELLNKQQPEATKTFDPIDCLIFEYRYLIMPQGLLSRFIVRTRELSSALPRWRTGVLLKDEANRALVRADSYDKRVEILVAGPTSERHRLLGVIRSHCEAIHASLQIQPQAWLAVPGILNEYVSYQELLTFNQQGVSHLPKVVGNQAIVLDVQDLLESVDGKVHNPNGKDGK